MHQNNEPQLSMIFVMGAPRSATTYLAKRIANELQLPVFPETQFLEAALSGNGSNDYIEENWPGVDLDRTREDPRHALCRAITAKYEQNYDFSPGLDTKIVFMDHTPQNILVARKLRKSFPESLMFFCLRWPPLAVSSLASQPWYDKGFLAASAYNFKCLLAAIRSFPTIDLVVNVEIPNTIETALFMARHHSIDHETIGANDDWYINSEELRASHAYLTEKNTKQMVWFELFLAQIISIPNQLAYFILTRLSARSGRNKFDRHSQRTDKSI